MKIQNPSRCHSCEGRNPVRPLKQKQFFIIYTKWSFFLTFSWGPAFAGMTTGGNVGAYITSNWG